MIIMVDRQPTQKMALTFIFSLDSQWHISAETQCIASTADCLGGSAMVGFETLMATVFSIQKMQQDAVRPCRPGALVPQKALKLLCPRKHQCSQGVREHLTRPDGHSCRASNFLHSNNMKGGEAYEGTKKEHLDCGNNPSVRCGI